MQFIHFREIRSNMITRNVMVMILNTRWQCCKKMLLFHTCSNVLNTLQVAKNNKI